MSPFARVAWVGVAAAAAFVFAQCATAPSAKAGAAAFATVYEVLQHPRCKNCHPAGDAPLQGDEGRRHGQNVLGGPDGQGLYAMRCANCHRDSNTAGSHMPPGAPGWHLPRRDMPLVFEGRAPADLARQLVDPARNGGRSAADLLHHVTHDPLVLWGWNPGEGRGAVTVPHATFVARMQEWIGAGCPIPE